MLDLLIQLAAACGPIALAIMGVVVSLSPPTGRGHKISAGAFAVVGILAAAAISAFGTITVIAKVAADAPLQRMTQSEHWLATRIFHFQPYRLSITMRTADTGANMRRREFVAGVVSFAAVTRAAGQPVANSRRLAIIDVSTPISRMYENSESYYRVLFTELRRLGQIEGRNLTVERYGKEQNPSDPAAFAAQVIRGNPDVMCVLVPVSVFIKETSKIPIVTITGDPVAAGYVQSMAHPGGNITGVSVDAGPSIHGKRIALLREMFPAMSKLGCIAGRVQWETGAGAAVRAAADAAGVSLISQLVDFPGNATTYGNAIARVSRDGSDAIMMLDNPDAYTNRVSIVQSIAEARIPAIHAFTSAVDAGGLMAYAFDLKEVWKRVADDIDAILRGSNPAEIPYYQVSKFELSINLKTAKALGLAVPTTLLASAEKVVE